MSSARKRKILGSTIDSLHFGDGENVSVSCIGKAASHAGPGGSCPPGITPCRLGVSNTRIAGPACASGLGWGNVSLAFFGRSGGFVAKDRVALDLAVFLEPRGGARTCKVACDPLASQSQSLAKHRLKTRNMEVFEVGAKPGTNAESLGLTSEPMIVGSTWIGGGAFSLLFLPDPTLTCRGLVVDRVATTL